MTSLPERIKFLRRRMGVTQEQLGGLCGVSKAAVAQWEGGYTTPTTDKLRALAGLCGVSLDWLVSDDSTIPPADAIQAPAAKEPPAHYGRRIPVVGHAQLGDNGNFVELEYPAGHGDGFVVMPSRDPHAYALRCEGDSMLPRIRPGEFVVVEPSFEAAPGDDVVVKSADGRVMVKTLLYLRDGRVYLGSVNNSHPTISVPASDVAVMHRVLTSAPRSLWEPE